MRMPKVFKYEVGDKVVVDNYYGDNEHYFVGLEGEIIDLNKTGTYDYFVSLKNEEANFKTSFMESELRKLNTYNFSIGQFVKLKATGEYGTIEQVDNANNQVEIYFDDSTFGVVGMERIELASVNDSFIYDTGDIDFDDETVYQVEEKDAELTRTDQHRKVIEEIHNTFKIKNADYGNSFGEQYEEHGLLSAVIRLDDKMRRLKQLLKQDAQVKGESIRDTVLDLSNYAIMTVMELDKENEKNVQC